MVEQLIESKRQFGVREYLDSGGRWSEETFGKLKEILDERSKNPKRVRGVYIDQAQGMGVHTKLVITPEEAYLYAVLCQEPIEGSLSMQPLMAEVMRVMGNLNKRKAFMRFYSPHIDFDNSVLQREALRPPQREAPRIAYANRGVIFAYGQ